MNLCANRFRRVRFSGEGTYGLVYVARDKNFLNRFCAIKKYKTSDNGGINVDTLREVSNLRSLAHNINILKVFEVICQDGDFYMISEGMQRNLKQHLRQNDNLPFDDSVNICSQITNGMSFLHTNLFLHRDLKPQNILINDRLQIKVADFGQSCKVDVMRTMTLCVCTLWYRAPELLCGKDTYSFEVDAWSLGCVFFEVFTNTPRFVGNSEYGQLVEIFRVLGKPDAKWPQFDSSSFPNFMRKDVKFFEHSFEKYVHCLLHLDESKRMSIVNMNIILNNSLHSETKLLATAQNSFEEFNTDLNERTRSILVDWLIEVCYKFKVSESVIFATVYLIDSSLCTLNISKKKLQLIGVTCLSICCKYIEVYSPELHDYVYITANAYTEHEIIEMEQTILMAHSFKCFFSTFYSALQHRITSENKNAYLAVCESVLLDMQYSKYEHTTMASAILRFCQKQKDDGDCFEFVRKNLVFMMENRDKFSGYFKKYRGEEWSFLLQDA